MLKITLSVAALVSALFLLSSCTTYRNWSYPSHPKVTYEDDKWCVPWELKRTLNGLAERYGPVTVTSSNRWWLENWWIGGAWNSYHLNCTAVDFRVRGSPSSVVRYIKSQKGVGGIKHYMSGYYHIDTGPRRTW